jgi:nicotinamide-nucleotide amidase
VLAEILTIGDELCRGEIVDTNSSWLAAELWDRSITVAWMTSVRDERTDMIAAFRQASERADLLFVSGGLGPTVDDLTVDVLATLLGTTPIVDEPRLEAMKARFARASFKITPNNLRQVRIPSGSHSLGNSAGIAPGFELRLGRSVVYVMPGVPREMQAIFREAIVPRLPAVEPIAKKVFRVFGMGESHVDHALDGLVAGIAGATVHYQVTFPETLVKLVVRGEGGDVRLAALEKELRARLGDRAYGDGHAESLAAVLGRRLKERGATIAVAESCTGGMLGSLLTDVAGSSEYFRYGWITYANEAKEAMLGVKHETLEAHGAVSEPTVREMATGARAKAGSTLACAISGIAGPGGGTAEKPVGTVHIAVAHPDGVTHKAYVFNGARDQVRRLAAYWAMSMALGLLA